jgi:sporulation protein YlmC with PRC-barrel domain
LKSADSDEVDIGGTPVRRAGSATLAARGTSRPPKGLLRRQTIREFQMTIGTQGTAVESRETSSLIGSDKVEGTAVYRSNGDKVGSIERIMIDKRSGKVAYAVMSFGGFLGIGEDYYPLPWSLLTYNPRLEGYEVNIAEQQLKGAPRYGKHESWDWSDRARERKVYDYYGVSPYWGI